MAKRLTTLELSKRIDDTKWCQSCLKRRVNKGYSNCMWCDNLGKDKPDLARRAKQMTFPNNILVDLILSDARIKDIGADELKAWENRAYAEIRIPHYNDITSLNDLYDREERMDEYENSRYDDLSFEEQVWLDFEASERNEF